MTFVFFAIYNLKRFQLCCTTFAFPLCTLCCTTLALMLLYSSCTFICCATLYCELICATIFVLFVFVLVFTSYLICIHFTICLFQFISTVQTIQSFYLKTTRANIVVFKQFVERPKTVYRKFIAIQVDTMGGSVSLISRHCCMGPHLSCQFTDIYTYCGYRGWWLYIRIYLHGMVNKQKACLRY